MLINGGDSGAGGFDDIIDGGRADDVGFGGTLNGGPAVWDGSPDGAAQTLTLGEFRRVDPCAIAPKSFAAGSTFLDTLCPVGFDEGGQSWVIWSATGSNGSDVIRGFVWPLPFVLDDSAEVISTVLMAGTINAADVPLPLGETQENLNEALRKTRDFGFTIQGLDEVR